MMKFEFPERTRGRNEFRELALAAVLMVLLLATVI